MAVSKKDLQEFRSKKVQEKEDLIAEKEAAKSDIEDKVKKYRDTLENGLKLEFASQEAHLDGAIDVIDQIIGQMPDDEQKEDL